MSAPEDLWNKQLECLQNFYATGLSILAETDLNLIHPKPDPWRKLGEVWEEFLQNEKMLQGAEPPMDLRLRRAILNQAKANAALFFSLEEHCTNMQKNILELLPQLQTENFYQPQEKDTRIFACKT